MNIRAEGGLSEAERVLGETERLLKENGITAEGGRATIKHLFERYKISYKFGVMPKEIHALCVFSDGVEGYTILINSLFDDLEDSDLRKVMIKSSLLHELAHVLASDPAHYFSKNLPADGVTRAYREVLERYSTHPAFNSFIELRTELLASAIAFVNREAFLQVYYKTNADFRHISRRFCMPLDCCVKWAMIKKWPDAAHYLKFNVDEYRREDFYQPIEVRFLGLPTLDETLFKNQNTVAYTYISLKGRQDWSDFSNPSDGGRKYFCKAYFLRSVPLLGMPNKIVIIGYPEAVYAQVLFMYNMLQSLPKQTG